LTYAVLLVASLALAFRTWTHEDRGETAAGTVQPWQRRADDVVALEYTRPGQRLEIQRRGTGDAAYLWATVDTSAFVVGADAGQRLLDALASPHALRDLGTPDARERHGYGLDTARTRLLIRFRDGSRDLLMGGTTYMTGDRYVLDHASGHVYVLPQGAVSPLDDAAQMLPERRLHAFTPERVAAVTLRGAGRTLSMRRLAGAGGGTGEAGAPAPSGWAPAAGPERPDPAFGTFMQRLDGLWAASYAAREDSRTLVPVLRVDYADRWGRPLGFLELFRRPGSGPSPEYFARTELTRVLVRLYPGAGDNLAADVAQGL
jgi:hypothetical protein